MVSGILVLGLCSSVVLWIGAVQSETALVNTQFHAAATNRILAVERELESAIRAARATGAFLSNSSGATNAPLSEFLDSMQGEQPVPIAVSFRSQSRALYHDPERLVSIWPVSPTANSATFIPCQSSGASCLHLYLSLTTSAGDKSSLGFVVPVARLAERGLSYLSPFGIDIRLSSGGETRFEHLSRMRKFYRGSFWESLRGGLTTHQARWSLLNLSMQIDCSAVPGYLSAASTWQPWVVLASGLVATFLLAMLFRSLLNHAEGIEKLVAARTIELQLARDEAIAASTLKSRFLANVSHEIRTPLNGVLGMTQFLLDTELDASQRGCALTIQDSGEILLHLMNDLLDLSRIEVGQLSLNLVHFDLARTIQTVVDNVSESAFRKGLHFELKVCPATGGLLYADPVRLSQILMNLLGNAVKFTGEGSVSLQLTRIDSRLNFTVSDTGPGMDGPLLERLFGRFVQGDESSVRRFGGAGLGLAISRELVQMMGGRIWVESELGRGSRFHFELPLDALCLNSPLIVLAAPRRYRSEQAEQTEFSKVPIVSAAGPVVLVAEDNSVNQIVTKKMLEKLGFSVDLAVNGQFAVQAHLLKNYPVILMDCQMPVMDGFEATGLIRAYEHSSHRTPIIALTANAMVEDIQRCVDAGMDDHLSKPLSFAALRAALERWGPVIHPVENEMADRAIGLDPPFPSTEDHSSNSILCSEPT